MKNKSLLLLLILLFLSSCNSVLKLMLDKKYLEGSNDFKDILALKYLRYSDILFSYSDYRSSEYFAKMAVKTYRGNNKIAFKLDDYLLKQDPNTLADLYFLFNCWLYFETKNKNLGEASICKDNFNKLLAILEQKRKETLQEKIVEDDGKKERFLTKEEETFYILFAQKNKIDIYFDFDSYKLNAVALQQISAILKYVKNLKSDYRIIVVGHTDRAGKVIYNNTLAKRRANTVHNILNKNGVPKTLLSTEVAISKNPEVITKQNEKFQSNRRVEVIINTDSLMQDLSPQPFY